MAVRFRDRADAGEQLASRLSAYANQPDVLVLALPRGGVPVAFEVARALRAPLDLFLVRKLGVPGHEELAMSAIASDGIRVVNQDVVRALGISRPEIEAVAATEQRELERRERRYRGDRPPPMSRAASSFSWTMDWLPAPVFEPPRPRCARRARPGLSSPCPSPPKRPATS